MQFESWFCRRLRDVAQSQAAPPIRPAARRLAVLDEPLRTVVNAIRIFRRDKLGPGRDLIPQHLIGRVGPFGRRRDHGHGLDRIGEGGFIRVEAFLNPALRDELFDERVDGDCDIRPGCIVGQIGDCRSDAALELRKEGACIIVDLAVRTNLKPEAAE